MLVPVDNGRFMGLNDTEVSFINTDMICTITVKNAGDYKYCVITMINGATLNLTIESLNTILDAIEKGKNEHNKW